MIKKLNWNRDVDQLRKNLKHNKFLVPFNMQLVGLLRCKSFEKAIMKSNLVIDGEILRKLMQIFVYRSDKCMKLSGSDLIWKINSDLNIEPRSIFLLGASEDTNIKSQLALANFYSCEVNGYSPQLGFDIFDPIENALISRKINKFKADIVIVCFGAPKQELWIEHNEDIFSNCKLVMAAGGTLDFVAKKYKRAPQMIQRIGFESLYRLFVDKSWKRLFRIIISFRAIFTFIWMLK